MYIRRDKMSRALLRLALGCALMMLVYAQPALACWQCNTSSAQTTENGTTYYYMTGGCGTPPNHSWGNEDCHTQYYVIPGTSIQSTAYCNTYGYGCYYTEVNGGPGDIYDQGGGESGGGSCSRSANNGFCPAYCASCTP